MSDHDGAIGRTTAYKSDSVINLSMDDFAGQVLELAQGDTEDAYNDRILASAKQYNVAPRRPAQSPILDSNKLPPQSLSLTPASIAQPRTSISSDSQASAISLPPPLITTTAIPSQSVSAAIPFSGTASRPGLAKDRTNSHGSLFQRLREKPRPVPRPIGTHSLTTSPVLTPIEPSSPSTQSLPIGSPQKKSFARGLSGLRLRRAESDQAASKECAHCLAEGCHKPRPVHRLACGHVYCRNALRKMVKTSIGRGRIATPLCCKQPIPIYLVEAIMSDESQEQVMLKMAAWSNNAQESVRASSETRTPVVMVEPRPSSKSRHRTLFDESSVWAVQQAQYNLTKAMYEPEFRAMRKTQIAQRDRLMRLDKQHKEELVAALAIRKQDLSAEFDRRTEGLYAEHANINADVEDKHVSAEGSLRIAQDIEKRNHSVALRHMEAYCRGQGSTGQPHYRSITDQDRRELARARHTHDQMDFKHQSAINVLRGEQNQRLRARRVRQAHEFGMLGVDKDLAMRELEATHADDLGRWDQEVSRNKAKLREWWYLQTETWRQKVAWYSGMVFDGRIPSVSWSARDANTADDNNDHDNDHDSHHEHDNGIRNDKDDIELSRSMGNLSTRDDSQSQYDDTGNETDNDSTTGGARPDDGIAAASTTATSTATADNSDAVAIPTTPIIVDVPAKQVSGMSATVTSPGLHDHFQYLERPPSGRYEVSPLLGQNQRQKQGPNRTMFRGGMMMF